MEWAMAAVLGTGHFLIQRQRAFVWDPCAAAGLRPLQTLAFQHAIGHGGGDVRPHRGLAAKSAPGRTRRPWRLLRGQRSRCVLLCVQWLGPVGRVLAAWPCPVASARHAGGPPNVRPPHAPQGHCRTRTARRAPPLPPAPAPQRGPPPPRPCHQPPPPAPPRPPAAPVWPPEPCRSTPQVAHALRGGPARAMHPSTSLISCRTMTMRTRQRQAPAPAAAMAGRHGRSSSGRAWSACGRRHPAATMPQSPRGMRAGARARAAAPRPPAAPCGALGCSRSLKWSRMGGPAAPAPAPAAVGQAGGRGAGGGGAAVVGMMR